MDPDIKPYPRRLVSMNPHRLVPGAVGGLVAGIVFGIWWQAFGILGDVAVAVGSQGLVVAWVVHLLMSTLFGAAFGAIADVVTPGSGIAWGLAWGVGLFAVVALIVFRSLLSEPTTLDTPALITLAGHLIYGAVLGLVYVMLRTRVSTDEELSTRPSGYRSARD